MKKNLQFLLVIVASIFPIMTIAQEPDERGIGGTGHDTVDLEIFDELEMPERMEMPDAFDMLEGAASEFDADTAIELNESLEQPADTGN